MGKDRLQLGDLVKLDGLEKPGEGVLTMELGGEDVKTAGVEQLEKSMSDFAGRLEGDENVSVSAMVGLVMAARNALQHELAPENVEELLETLRWRFEFIVNMDMHHPGMEWEKVKAKLETSPDKLWSLNQMEITKGKPDVVGFDEKTDEFIFMDCSTESPEGRRNCVYDRKGEEYLKKNDQAAMYDGDAVSMAVLMGVDILTEEEYGYLQTKGEYDRYTWSWIKTPVATRNSGVALVGDSRGSGVYVVQRHAPYLRFDRKGWRGVLRV